MVDIKTIENVYKIFYFFLSKLPEEKAMNIGQFLLKKMPIEKLENILKNDDERLHVRIGNVELKNPVILSSYYECPKMLEKLMHLGFGAVTTKTITLGEEKGNPSPTVVRRGDGFVNCVGLKNPGAYVYKEELKKMKKTIPLIVSVTGEKVWQVCRTIKILEDYADIFELNISCPSSNLDFCKDHKKAYSLFAEVKQTTKKPIIVKFSPDYPNKELLRHARYFGIEAINFANTSQVEDKRLSIGYGGLSGPELFDKVRKEVPHIHEFFPNIKIIATGGIDSEEKAYDLIERGASAVSYLSAFITEGPTLTKKINNYLIKVMHEKKAKSIEELIDR